jgi:hypothetical protein
MHIVRSDLHRALSRLPDAAERDGEGEKGLLVGILIVEVG